MDFARPDLNSVNKRLSALRLPRKSFPKVSLRGFPASAGFVTFLITALLSFFVAVFIEFLLGWLISLSVPLRVPAIVCVGGRRWG